MRKICLLPGLVLFTLVSFAQKNGTIKGTAIDTISKQPVAGATVTVVGKKDSSLVSFTMTDNSGKFELPGVHNGEYRLMITHVNYHNSNTFFTINDDNKSRDFGNIIMNDKNKVLEEVVVTNEAPPVTMVGDTVQYNAGSFKVQHNASVEQLLKKLPGVKVEKNFSEMILRLLPKIYRQMLSIKCRYMISKATRPSLPALKTATMKRRST